MIDFFRINMPYGMVRNDKGEWCFFNREYTYLGSKDSGKIQDDSPFFVYMLILQMSFWSLWQKKTQ